MFDKFTVKTQRGEQKVHNIGLTTTRFFLRV